MINDYNKYLQQPSYINRRTVQPRHSTGKNLITPERAQHIYRVCEICQESFLLGVNTHLWSLLKAVIRMHDISIMGGNRRVKIPKLMALMVLSAWPIRAVLHRGHDWANTGEESKRVIKQNSSKMPEPLANRGTWESKFLRARWGWFCSMIIACCRSFSTTGSEFWGYRETL